MLEIPLVDIKWLEELFRRGNALTVESEPDENGVVALESHFVLPNEQDFRPKSVKTDDEDEDITGFKHVTPKDITLAALRMDVKSIDCGLETFGPPISLAQHRKSSECVWLELISRRFLTGLLFKQRRFHLSPVSSRQVIAVICLLRDYHRL
jgi:hypothetical protein